MTAGIVRKVGTGGTPAKAPIGYKNVRREVDGAEVRTVEVDPDQAPHVRWMFEVYASGEYTITRLLNEVTERGLPHRATRKLGARPLSRSSVQRILTNPYYTGVVVYKGAEYPGRHEPLITPERFNVCRQSSWTGAAVKRRNSTCTTSKARSTASAASHVSR